MVSIFNANGIVNVIKPPHMTSHDVVNHIKRRHNLKKVGHTGTLDPMASGLMTICIGKATKISEYLLSEDKSYRAEITFGLTTDTQDIWGSPVAVSGKRPSYQDFSETLNLFRGSIEQKPPMYSAVRHHGKKLYELAREGVTVERKSRSVEIKALEVIHFDTEKAIIDIACTKGTYIRTLCNDIGDTLGCGAVMSFLLRTSSGPFELKNAVPFDCENLMDFIVKTGDALYDFKEMRLDDSFYTRLYHGNEVRIPIAYETGRLYKIYSGNRFLGIGRVVSIDSSTNSEYVKIDKLLI